MKERNVLIQSSRSTGFDEAPEPSDSDEKEGVEDQTVIELRSAYFSKCHFAPFGE